MGNHIVNVPPNEIYMRVQSNTTLDKSFKKSILNMYKRHPRVTEQILDVIDTIKTKNIVPKGSILSDGVAYYRDANSITLSDTLFEDIRDKYQTYIEGAINILAVNLRYSWKKLPVSVMYFLIELNDGSFKEIYYSSKQRQNY